MSTVEEIEAAICELAPDEYCQFLEWFLTRDQQRWDDQIDHRSRRFWALFRLLPPDVRRLAIRNYELWRNDPNHPSLRFRKLQGSESRYTVRIGDHHRALALRNGDEIIWVWIGSHADYDRLTAMK